jgi:4-hydroxy-3-methylbut-2-en-1-yl diphosphate reductase
MEIVIDETAGFCWGVVRTIDKVEERLNSSDKSVYILGHIIHNPAEIRRLESLGMKTISYDELELLPKDTSEVIIRAHGEPPSTYARTEALELSIIDATCPLVKTLQSRIKKYYDEGWQIVVLGERNHAEVIGIRGVCNDECIVIRSTEEALEKIDFSRRTVLFSQTTMDKPTFHAIEKTLQEKFIALCGDRPLEDIFLAKDTICKYVSGREAHLRRFAESCDIVLFVAGRNSSNGRSLFKICSKANSRTFFVEDVSEIENIWFDGVERVGITGATSTPQWYLRKIKEVILSNQNDNLA